MANTCPNCGSTNAAATTAIAPHGLAYGLSRGLALISKSRAGGYRAMARGDLAFYMDGRRRMVTHQALLDYMALMTRRTQEMGSIAPTVRRSRRIVPTDAAKAPARSHPA